MTDTKALAALSAETQPVMELIRRTDKKNPDKADVEALRAYLEKAPGLWRLAGDLQTQATLMAIRDIKGPVVIKESLSVGRLELQRELGYQGATQLERMLIDHVILCWLRMQIAEYRYQSILQDSVTLNQADYHERKMTATQARYLRAVETLARIRRLALPALQVNIADKQVNLAGR